MDCSNLAATGADPGYLLLAAAVVLLAGLLIVFVGRGRRKSTALIATMLLAFGLICIPLGSPAAQAAVDCVADPGPANSLTITQTSTMTGLAPNVAPTAITGLVTNNSTDETYIVEIVVSILGVTKVAGAAAGACDATDYLLMEPAMPVGQMLTGGASAPFSGASIGFADKLTKQDACQGATVTLLYTAG